MPDLCFNFEGAEAVPYAAAPTLALKLRITNQPADEIIRSIMLQCQIQIEAPRRRYSPEEQKHLLDLYGEPERWGQTLRTSLWTHAIAQRAIVQRMRPRSMFWCPALSISTSPRLSISMDSKPGRCRSAFCSVAPCFSTIPEQGLSITQIPWAKEARFRLPVSVWKTGDRLVLSKYGVAHAAARRVRSPA